MAVIAELAGCHHGKLSQRISSLRCAESHRRSCIHAGLGPNASSLHLHPHPQICSESMSGWEASAFLLEASVRRLPQERPGGPDCLLFSKGNIFTLQLNI